MRWLLRKWLLGKPAIFTPQVGRRPCRQGPPIPPTTLPGAVECYSARPQGRSGRWRAPLSVGGPAPPGARGNAGQAAPWWTAAGSGCRWASPWAPRPSSRSPTSPRPWPASRCGRSSASWEISRNCVSIPRSKWGPCRPPQRRRLGMRERRGGAGGGGKGRRAGAPFWVRAPGRRHVVPPLCMAGAAGKQLRPHLRWRHRPFSPFPKNPLSVVYLSSSTLGAGELDRRVQCLPSLDCLYSFSFIRFWWKGFEKEPFELKSQ